MPSMGLQADIASYSTAASACASSDAWQASLALLDEVSLGRLRLDTICLGVSLSACEKGSAWHLALSTLMEMSEQQVEVNEISLSAILRSCQRAHKWEEAIQILSKASEWRALVGLGMYNAVLGALSSSRSWERALRFFERLDHYTLEADAVTLNTLTSSYESGFQWQLALCTLMSFGEHSIQPDVRAFNIAIASSAAVQNWHAALALMGWMGETQQEERGVWPDLITYNTVLGACKQQESWHISLLLLRALQDSEGFQPDINSYMETLGACALGHAWESALGLLEEMNSASLPLGIARNLAASACRWARPQEAEELLRENLRAGSSDGVTFTFKAILGLVESDALTQLGPFCLEALSAECAKEIEEAAEVVIAVAILHWHESLRAEVYQRLLRHLGNSARIELKRLSSPDLSLSGNLERLENPILERQFGLSPLLTLSILEDLKKSCSPASWRYRARLGARSFEVDSFDEDPTSKDLAAWAAWSLPAAQLSRGRCQGSAADGVEEVQLLRPVQVQHDRRAHAERQLLLRLLQGICRR